MSLDKKVEGKTQELKGKATGDSYEETKGKLKQAAGHAEDDAKSLADKASDAFSDATEAVKDAFSDDDETDTLEK